MEKESLQATAPPPAYNEPQPPYYEPKPMEYPPPYSPYPQQQQQQGGFVMPPGGGMQPQPASVIQVIQTPLPNFGTTSVNIRCPYCQKDIRTAKKRRYNFATHMLACLLCWFCCPCFAWVPYCTDSVNDIEHECPRCKKFLGIFSRSGVSRR